MCIAVPGKVIEISGMDAKVDFNGNIVKVNVGLVAPRVGQYVLCLLYTSPLLSAYIILQSLYGYSATWDFHSRKHGAQTRLDSLSSISDLRTALLISGESEPTLYCRS